jgi:hypothetical protein
MTKAALAAICALSAALTGCARWEPEQASPVKLTRACPLQRGPEVAAFGEGVSGVYSFVTQDAPERELAEFLRTAEASGFSLIPMAITLNGKDTLVATGPALLRNQFQADAEFQLACSLGGGAVYLTHVRYNAPEENRGSVRVR